MSASAIPPERTTRGALLAWGAVALLAGICVLLARGLGSTWVYDLWSDRDLMRAARLGSMPEVTGAELSYGSGVRIPGSLQYLLMAPWLQGGASPVGAYRMQALLEGLGVLLLGREAWTRWGLWAGAVTVGVWGVGRVPNEVGATLWNPGFVPLFACALTVASVRLVGGGRPQAWTLWIAALAAGAQMHLSVALLAAFVLPMLVVWGPPRARGPVLRGLGLAAVLYLPFLVHELVWGARTLKGLLAPGQAAALAPGASWGTAGTSLWAVGAAWVDVHTPLELMTYHPVVGGLGVVASALLGLGLIGVWGRALVGAIRGRELGPDRRVVGLLAGVWLLMLVYLALGPLTAVSLGQGERYVLMLWPSTALLAGWGAAAAVRAAGSRASTVAAALALLLAVRAGALVLDAGSVRRSLRSWTERVAVLAEVQAVTGWSLVDVAGRVVLAPGGDVAFGRTWDTLQGIDHVLHRVGATFDGSQPPPCGLLVPVPSNTDVAHPPFDAAYVQAVLDQPLPELKVLDVLAVGSRHQLVRYTLAGQACRTSFTNRYVDTPEEVTLRSLWGAPPGTVRELAPPGPDVRRFGAVVPDPRHEPGAEGETPLVLGVDLSVRPDGVGLTLHSNALRGQSHNGGWLAEAMLTNPRLVLRDPTSGDVLTLPIAAGPVGGRTQLTPLRAVPQRVPAGTWSVRLLAEVVVDPATWAAGGALTVPLDLPLTDSFEVR